MVLQGLTWQRASCWNQILFHNTHTCRSHLNPLSSWQKNLHSAKSGRLIIWGKSFIPHRRSDTQTDCFVITESVHSNEMICLMSDHLTLTTEAKKPPRWHYTTPPLPLPPFFLLCLPCLGARERKRGIYVHSERAGSAPIPCDGNISIDQSKWRHVKLPRQLAGQWGGSVCRLPKSLREDWLQEHQGGAVWAGNASFKKARFAWEKCPRC